MKKKNIRYAVVGIGHIAQVAVLPAFEHCKNSELVTLVSGDPEKQLLLGREYHLKETFSYEEYDRCLESGLIDAVYIALPNHLHRDYTVRAAQHGIHVLCEKPMAVSSSDCQTMIQACDDHRVRLMIAYRLHFEAANLRAIELIHHERKIGDPRILQSMHSQATRFPNIRTESIKLGGGPSYDLGVYDINASRYLFQDEPLSVFAECANIGKRPFKEIEETMSVVLRFPKERLASIVYSFGAAQTDIFRVAGTKGNLSVEPAYTYEGAKNLTLTVEGRSRSKTFAPRDHFSPEIDYFSDCIVNNRIPEPSGIEGLADIRIIEAIYESARTGKVVQLTPLEKFKKLTIRQEIDRPAFREPNPIHAKAPTKKQAA